MSCDFTERARSRETTKPLPPSRCRDAPSVAFIVHSFNRISNIDQIVAGLRQTGTHEIVVCDDGSLDGSRQKWVSHLTQPNNFLILSNDLHEIRVLDRAIRFASAEIICLVQDDDLIPRGTEWLRQVLEQFTMHPDLAIVGGFMGFKGISPDPAKVKRLWQHAPFEFVDHVNIGPYFVRKRCYEALGGWDYSFSDVGEPGICFDNELCLRAWLNGYRVGYRFVPFKGPPGQYSRDGGTVLFSGPVRRRNQLRNEKAIYEKYSGAEATITSLVAEANASLAEAR